MAKKYRNNWYNSSHGLEINMEFTTLLVVMLITDHQHYKQMCDLSQLLIILLYM